MRKVTVLIGTFLIVLFSSCEGDQGPPGFDGIDGQDGIQGQVFQLNGVNFGYNAATNQWSALETFADYTDFEIFESDAVLVYRLDGLVDLNDGSTADNWSLIPQNFFVPAGTLQYTVNHTFLDFEVFIDGNFDLSALSTGFTDDQTFRIVILPSEFLQGSDLGTTDLSSVMGKIGLGSDQVETIRFD